MNQLGQLPSVATHAALSTVPMVLFCQSSLQTNPIGLWINERFERRFRQERKGQPTIFLDRHHKDLIGLSSLSRRRLFLSGRPWRTAYQPKNLSNVLFPFVFYYFSNQGL